MKTQAISVQPQAASKAASRPNACWRFLSKLFREKRLGAIGAVVAVVFLFVGLFADVLAPYGMNEVDMGARLQAPSWAHPFGTDNLGRDLLSRCMYGAQISVIIGLTVAAISTVISALIGIISGYFGGKVDLVIQRFVDAWMSFPGLVVLIVVASVFGAGITQIVFTLGLLIGIGGSRIVRSAVVSVREDMYIHAAKSIGASAPRILWRHVLPNVIPPLIVLFTSSVGTAILAESGLSFLGLGVPPPHPTWGGMLSGNGRTYMLQGPWLALAPGICLTLVVYAINVFGDALRDMLDPRMRGSR
ncbi:ABC transporter permease [Comamonas aquatica]|jgi:peptide/nickel transport system permease protein|uniref:ABC transporter permease n=1 Tax=Comamonas aquatica TaxID=225991 RepID=UPI0011D82AEE|nr:ABC transporter permease [Comamonas aquatica]MDH0201044.1 ABC transporter permease [Comamonas aquatica]MDH1447529.1 ABC transporter permease [Comamonas aquatica]TXH39779.1 MAG: ABC transporter permease [Burkholderiaceae bacterium]HPU20477.1 ABC transporter permease [Alicycliphilus sp.]